jgi:hypothetical protein
MQPNGQPWIWVRIPDNFDADVIKIFPLADLHKGGKTHARDSLLQYIAYIADHDNAFGFGTGDWLENALRDSIGAGVYESDSPQTEAEQLSHDILPIAHKIFFAHPGNHEDRTYNRVGLCPLRFMCERMDIPYINDQVHMTVFWRGNHWHFFSFHGSTSSRTKGGKINEALRPRNFQGHVHFIVMSHVHDQMSNPVQCIVRNMETFELEMKLQYPVIAPSFLDYFSSYASKKAMEPGAQGAVALALYPDGDYKVDPWGD